MKLCFAMLAIILQLCYGVLILGVEPILCVSSGALS